MSADDEDLTYKKFEAAMVESFHSTAFAADKVYNKETATWAIRTALRATFTELARFTDQEIADMVRKLARTIPKEKNERTKKTGS